MGEWRAVEESGGKWKRKSGVHKRTDRMCSHGGVWSTKRQRRLRSTIYDDEEGEYRRRRAEQEAEERRCVDASCQSRFLPSYQPRRNREIALDLAAAAPYILTSSAHGQRVSRSKSRTHNHDIQVLFACRAAEEDLEGGARLAVGQVPGFALALPFEHLLFLDSHDVTRWWRIHTWSLLPCIRSALKVDDGPDLPSCNILVRENDLNSSSISTPQNYSSLLSSRRLAAGQVPGFALPLEHMLFFDSESNLIYGVCIQESLKPSLTIFHPSSHLGNSTPEVSMQFSIPTPPASAVTSPADWRHGVCEIPTTGSVGSSVWICPRLKVAGSFAVKVQLISVTSPEVGLLGTAMVNAHASGEEAMQGCDESGYIVRMCDPSAMLLPSTRAGCYRVGVHIHADVRAIDVEKACLKHPRYTYTAVPCVIALNVSWEVSLSKDADEGLTGEGDHDGSTCRGQRLVEELGWVSCRRRRGAPKERDLRVEESGDASSSA
ncbi:hypothetical protein B0H13DRAFT_2406421 [Mycena leptocephala]|nr:hypothetical protein B0H13DRAFT_2406421 [Mycena leptocephala]